MPVTQRWVHAGLICAVVIFSMCLTILVLGASRTHESNTGLPGSKGAGFRLKDAAQNTVEYDVRMPNNPIQVLIFAEHGSGEVSKYADQINSLVSTYRDTPSVRILGISYVYDPSVLGSYARDASQLEIRCPFLHTAKDYDGTVARAYRVSSPTLFVVDRAGVIRGRILLSQPSWMVSVAELINTLNPSGPAIKSLLDNSRAGG